MNSQVFNQQLQINLELRRGRFGLGVWIWVRIITEAQEQAGVERDTILLIKLSTLKRRVQEAEQMS